MNAKIEGKEVIPSKETTLEISQDVQAETLNNNNVIETIFNELSDTDKELGDIETFALMLSLPDELLKQIEPIFMGEIEDILNDSNVALNVASALNIAELTQEDLTTYTDLIFKEIESQLGEQLTPYKIDFLKHFFTIIFNSAELGKVTAQRMIQIPIEKCHPDAVIPSYARLGDAGLDIYSLDEYTILPGETKLIPTGLKVAIPRGYELQVRPKSGLSLRTKMRLANTPGTIDSGYRDEVGIIVENIDPPIKDISYDFDDTGRPVITSILHGSSITIGKNEKIAQFVLSTVPTARFYEVEDVGQIGENRGGGFGSTGLALNDANGNDSSSAEEKKKEKEDAEKA